jgi:uncharacterized membrane protein YhaH (DUF805 family)
MKGVRAVLIRVTGRLYLGDDHVLYLEERNYTERARRFYFRDIQMITYSENSAWLVFGAIYALAALVFGGVSANFAFMASGDWADAFAWTFFSVFFGILALVPAVASLRRFLDGPSCRCYLHTAVQETELLAVRKVRHARRFISLMRPHIEAAQAELAVAIPQSAPDAPSAVVVPSNFAKVRRVITPAAPVERPPLKPHAHAVAFVLVLGLGLSYPVDLIDQSSWKDNIELLVLLGAVVSLVVALIQQASARCPRDLFWYTWLTMGVLAVGHVWGIGLALTLAMEDPEFFRQGGIDSAALKESPAFQVYIVLIAMLFASLSLLGLIRLVRGVYVAPASAMAAAEQPQSPMSSSMPETLHE